MKKVFGLTVAGLALASVAAYAAQEHDHTAQDSQTTAAMEMQCDGSQSMRRDERHSGMRGHSEGGMRHSDMQMHHEQGGHGMRQGMMHGRMMHGGMMGHGAGSDSTYPKDHKQQ